MLGIALPNGCVVSHGESSNVKKPFTLIPGLEMHELSSGHASADVNSDSRSSGVASAFQGQLGFIPFKDTHRLPRHVHIGESPNKLGRQSFMTERILVLKGVALVELNGAIYIIPPGSLVSIAPGVPHTWNACPTGITLPDGLRSDGEFLMVYEYEAPTGFFPTAQTETLKEVGQYQRFKGDLETIRFPDLTAPQVKNQAHLIWGRHVRRTEVS